MSISGHHTATGPAEVLAEVADRVRALDEMLWSARTDGELVAAVAQIQALRATVAAVEADAVAEAHARQTRRRSCTTGRPVTGSPTSAGFAAARGGGSSPGRSP